MIENPSSPYAFGVQELKGRSLLKQKAAIIPTGLRGSRP